LILEFAIFAQRLFGEHIAGFAKRQVELQKDLGKAGLFLNIEAYVSLMILFSIITLFGTTLNVFVAIYVLTGSVATAAVVGIGLGTAGAGITFATFYIYPRTIAGKKRRAIEESLPFTLSFMGILSAAGVPPKRIFKTLALLEQEKGVGLGGEAQVIYRDMELLGEDIISVLRDVARRRISSIFSGVLEGMISAIKSGGSLTNYLEEESRGLMRLRRSIMREFIDTLVMISEVYMSVLVAFPLIMIVMLVVMSSIGGGIGGVSPGMIVPLIIYGLVPGAGIAVLIMLDAMMPR